MKRYIHSVEVSSEELSDILGMANLVPKRTGLPCDIWSDHSGGKRKVSHSGSPRAKIGYQGNEISVSIEPSPRILAPKHLSYSKSVMKCLKQGIDYIGRNHDLFLKHYLDEDDSFDDEDLFIELRKRGEYK